MGTAVRKIDTNKSVAEIFELFKDEKYSVFLDTSLSDKRNHFSIVGINPYLRMMKKNEKLYVNDKLRDITFEEYLEKYLAENEETNNYNIPIISGGIGYFSYDYGRKLNKNKEDIKTGIIPECQLIFYDNFIIEDLDNGNIFVTSSGKCQSTETFFEKIEAILKEDTSCKDIQRISDIKVESNFTREEYVESVDKMINHIREGDIYVVNLTRQLIVESKRTPYEVFRYMRSANPSPYGAYMNYEDFIIVSASPERFLKMDKGNITTRPIKGTRKRGNDQKEDERLKQELLDSEKDKSELLMIIDLERNDLNRVCVPGSVKVTDLYHVEEYATVFQLVANVEGKLEDRYGFNEVFHAMFPGGSITGAPKRRAMEIIEEVENGARGIYTGCIGYVSFDRSCDLNIVIRTAVYKDNKYYIGVGGGITCESDPQFEYEETEQKAKAVLEAIRGGADDM